MTLPNLDKHSTRLYGASRLLHFHGLRTMFLHFVCLLGYISTTFGTFGANFDYRTLKKVLFAGLGCLSLCYYVERY